MYEFHPSDRALLLRVGKVLRAESKAAVAAYAAAAPASSERRTHQERAGRLQGDLHELDQLRRRLEACQVPPATARSE